MASSKSIQKNSKKIIQPFDTSHPTPDTTAPLTYDTRSPPSPDTTAPLTLDTRSPDTPDSAMQQHAVMMVATIVK